MICRRGGFIIQRHNELRDLEAELLNVVCNDVQIEPVLQEVNGETSNPGSNESADARLDVHGRETKICILTCPSICHPNAEYYIESYNLTPKQM